jgi:cation diffusion facilitator family transporter
MDAKHENNFQPNAYFDGLKENRLISRVAFSAFLLNLLLASVKGYLAYQSSSLAVTAGAIDSASDSVASLAVFGGLLLSTLKTRAFPQGLYKIENLISVVVALFIFFAGYEIASRLIYPPSKPPDITLPMLWWLIGCTVAIFLFGKLALYLGNKTGSPALKAEGRHRQVDVLSSLVVMISVLLNYFQIHFQYHFLTIDRIAALLVLIFIAKAGWDLLSDGMRVLLDASVDHATLDKARIIIENEPAVKEIKSLVGRSAGRFRFLNAEITLRTNGLKKAHHIADRIEETIKKEIPHVERIMLHYAPSGSDIQRIAFPVLEDGNTLCEHFGEAPYFVIWQIRPERMEIEKKTILKNPFRQAEKGKGIQAARFLVKYHIDKVAAQKKLQFSGPSYVFSDAGVETVEITENTAEDAIMRYFMRQFPGCSG